MIVDEHDTLMALLDAYTTNELEFAERELIEAHLPACEECQQWLVNIPQLHTLLRLQDVPTTSSKESENVLYSASSHLVSTLDVSVLASIANDKRDDEKWENHKIPAQAVRNLPVQRQKKIPELKHPWRPAILAVAICCTIIFVGGWFQSGSLPFISQITDHGGERSYLPPKFWMLNQKQTMIHSGNDVFALKNVIISDRTGIHFFFASRSTNQNDVPQIRVISVLPSQPKETIQVAAKVQTFGSLNAFKVGMLQTPYLNRTGQTITIQIKFSDQTSLISLSPLVQNYPDPGIDGTFYVDQNNFADVTWHEIYSTTVDVAFFQSQVAGQSEMATSRLFLRLDNPVKVITEAEYRQLVSRGPPSSPCKECRPPLSITAIVASATAQSIKKK